MSTAYKRWISEASKRTDFIGQDYAAKFEAEVQNTFQRLETTMTQVRLPTIPGTKYHTGRGIEVYEQPEQPGLANMNKANYDRLMRVMTQLEPNGDYTEEEENKFDDDENDYLVATETGQITIKIQNQQNFRNNRQKRWNPSDSDGENTVIDLTERNPTDLKHKSEQVQEKMDTSNDNTQQQSRVNTPSWASTTSTISDNEELEFEYQVEETMKMDLSKTEKTGLARPKAGWNSSSFASFGSVVAAANNTKLIPRAPQTARFYWMTATSGQHGKIAGHPDEEYINRIKKMMKPRLDSRQTTQETRDILSRKAELMPRNSNWAQLTKNTWKKKFPESSIYSDPAFQKSRDPDINRKLPARRFNSEDFGYIRNRPVNRTNRQMNNQNSVSQQNQSTENSRSPRDQNQETNQIQPNRQSSNSQPEDQVTNKTKKLEDYVKKFLDEGDKWQKQPQTATYLARYKKGTDFKTAEKTILLSTQSKVKYSEVNL